MAEGGRAGCDPDLFAVVRHRGQDGAQGLEAHGDVQQVSSKEEIVVVSQDGHGRIPHQVQERLHQNNQSEHANNTHNHTSNNHIALTLSVNTTPSFQMWYLVSIELSL